MLLTGVTLLIAPPVRGAVRASAKSAASTPATASLKVTVQLALVALLGLAAARVIELTVGAVLSTSTSTGPDSPDVAVQEAKRATTR
ncbi:MAG: hypothetical protein Q8K79_06720 [Solirubrobacteraceae bacterium]|nr:hypothetical protein [Solirubrobacteraceae bacterium]